MNTFLTLFFTGFAVSIVYDSFFEWWIHRYVMHRKFAGVTYPFRQHALVHHHVFRADETYHLQTSADQKTVPMAWWNGPVLVAMTQIPFLILAWGFGAWPLLYGALLASSLYYATYEYLHWCMHIPRRRSIERSGLFFRLNGHHLLHHRYMGRNFNVVFPLADWCLGTLMLRSPIRFRQAKGPGVPNVQPQRQRRELAPGRFFPGAEQST
jgi:hypothetical protein